ncbi:sodium/potassium/calcium exchanger 3-like [Tropilaelaps mercedesae]|uniref:Sodium/potassium/calcium exchanger 3-like n=1 Tax=Tropilaelaps mercedesae TaxID=418985 RepID=A0A1V9XNM4_9ACAR|nr:sodium/potassium/calcium exchanger 3-like [Tropilaelaps mercedesae]
MYVCVAAVVNGGLLPLPAQLTPTNESCVEERKPMRVVRCLAEFEKEKRKRSRSFRYRHKSTPVVVVPSSSCVSAVAHVGALRRPTPCDCVLDMTMLEWVNVTRRPSARHKAARRAVALVVIVALFVGIELTAEWRPQEKSFNDAIDDQLSWQSRDLLSESTKHIPKASPSPPSPPLPPESAKTDDENEKPSEKTSDQPTTNTEKSNGAEQQSHGSGSKDHEKSKNNNESTGTDEDSSPGHKNETEHAGNSTEKTKSHTTTSRPFISPSTIHPRHRIVAGRPNETCLQAAFHEFPPDIFSHKARKRGAVIVHMLVAIYMFYALAVVCDDYFISSLEECSQRLNLSDDVAGATFMAAGSSAPELFTATLGVIVAKGDVGTGTVVGSAVYNVLFVIAICGLYAGREVPVTWWPLCRDSVFYSFTVLVLIIVIADSKVSKAESIVMLLLYGVYIALMKFNRQIHLIVAAKFGLSDVVQCREMDTLTEEKQNNYGGSMGPRVSFYEAGLMMLCTRNFRPRTRFWAAAKRVMHNRQKALQGHGMLTRSESIVQTNKKFNWRIRPPMENGMKDQVLYWIRAPLLATLEYTIPDCKNNPGSKMFLVTFVMSIWWTAVFSYLMVWMVTLIGFTLNIPDSIMGITFLAAGTSIPDAYASLLVSKQGQGDMAIANCFGSNVFDILIGLAVPWLIQTTFIDPSGYAIIFSKGLLYTVVLLFLTIIITIIAIHRSGWLLTKKLGALLMVVYMLFLLLCSAIEFNVFANVNPPTCAEPDA